MKTIITIPFQDNLTEQQIININSWLAALRSGKYQQTIGALCKDGGFCCLGVCSIIREDATLIEDDGAKRKFSYIEAVEYYLNFPEENWMKRNYGFYYNHPVVYARVNELSIRKALAWLNDAGYTFETIANVIESVFIKKEKVKITV